MKHLIACSLLSLLLVTACGSAEKKSDAPSDSEIAKEFGNVEGAEGDEIPKSSEAPKNDKRSQTIVGKINLNKYLDVTQANLGIEKVDSANKGKPDLIVIFKKSDGASKEPVMHLFDLNRDGKIDLAKHFISAKLSRVEADLDYDGIVDVVSYLDPKTAETTQKVMADGSSNIWKYYFKNELRKKELDRNGDGKPDIWVYYRNGRVMSTEVDKDFKGTIVKINGPLRAALED